LTISKEEKQKIIGKFQADKNDTGSSNVQVAILTERIRTLTEHFKMHKKDNHSRRGLLAMVSKRRKLLSYIKKKNYQNYLDLIKALELRK